MSVGPPRSTGPTREKYQQELDWQLETFLPVFQGNEHKVEEYWRRYRQLDALAPLATGDVLDVGCGISTVLSCLYANRRVGVDPLANEYSRHHDYGGIEIVKGTAENLPFADDEFDAVFCTNCIDHVDDPRKALEQIRRCLRPDGVFIVSFELFTERGYRNAAHPHSLTRAMLGELIEGLFAVDREWTGPWVGINRFIRSEPETARKEWLGLLR